MTPLVVLLCLPLGVAAVTVGLLAIERWRRPGRPVSLPMSYERSLLADVEEARALNPDFPAVRVVRDEEGR